MIIMIINIIIYNIYLKRCNCNDFLPSFGYFELNPTFIVIFIVI
jgi:hypothetical protein